MVYISIYRVFVCVWFDKFFRYVSFFIFFFCGRGEGQFDFFLKTYETRNNCFERKANSTIRIELSHFFCWFNNSFVNNYSKTCLQTNWLKK